MSREGLSRRNVLKIGVLAAPFVWVGGRAFGADQITVADVGGAPAAAIRKAFYDPFEREMGIKVVNVAHESDPTTQFKLVVDTKSFIWDACSLTPGDRLHLVEPKNYLEPLNIQPDEAADLVPGMLKEDWLGFSVWTTIMGYRTDRFPKGAGPNSWADFWNVNRFPGRRGMYKDPAGTLEQALMADGVSPSQLYPLDVDRAFRSLNRIKPHINVWWTTGAQNTQILQSGEVAMTPVWGGRAFAAIDGGAPVHVVWSQGMYSSDGWAIPKGTPRADLARRFIRFCLKPEQQGVFSNNIANAPTLRKAFDFILPERAQRLATYPENLKSLVPSEAAWWGEHRPKVLERFQDWLLS